MPDEKRHSIFMTHGGQLTLTILSRKLYTDDFHWIIKYDGASKEYRFLSDKMNFGFRDDELHSIFRTPLIGEEDITQRLDNTLLSTVFYSLDSLFIFIKTYAPSIRMIALDANLTDIGGYEFRPEAHQALILSGAERALLFSEKEHCIDDTNRYLDGAHQNLALRPPTSLKHVIVSMRKNFPKEFAFRELPQQVVAKVATVSKDVETPKRCGCLFFKSRKEKNAEEQENLKSKPAKKWRFSFRWSKVHIDHEDQGSLTSHLGKSGVFQGT